MATNLSLTVPPHYGRVLLVTLGIIPVYSYFQSEIVTYLRLPARVPYPNHYATPEQAAASRAAYQLNCAQRAHGHLIENMAQTMLTMLVAGLDHPNLTAGLGCAWVFCRALFAYGYITSEKPGGKGRFLGFGSWVVQGTIWALCARLALRIA